MFKSYKCNATFSAKSMMLKVVDSTFTEDIIVSNSYIGLYDGIGNIYKHRKLNVARAVAAAIYRSGSHVDYIDLSVHNEKYRQCIRRHFSAMAKSNIKRVFLE